MVLFSILIIAFGLSFFILQRDEVVENVRFLLKLSESYFSKNNKANSEPVLSIFRQITMMIRKLGALETIIYPYTGDSLYTLHFGKLVIAFEVLLIILVPILLTNLLVKFFKNFLIIIVLNKF